MSRRLFQLVVIALVLIATLTPLMDTFDTWDHNPVPSHDTELQVVAFAVAIGMVITLAKLSRFLADWCTEVSADGRIGAASLPDAPDPVAIEPTVSPPVFALRI